MAENPYLKSAALVAEQQSPSPDKQLASQQMDEAFGDEMAVPTGQADSNPFMKNAQAIGNERDKAMIANTAFQERQAGQTSPDRDAEVARLSEQLDIEKGFVNRNLEQSKLMYGRQQALDGTRDTPATKKLLDDPTVGYVNDDWESLSYMERILKSVPEAYKKSEAMVDLADLQWRSMMTGPWPGSEELITEARSRTRREVEFGLDIVFGVPGAVAEQLPIYWSILKGASEQAVIWGAAGGLSGMMGGPYVMATTGLSGMGFGLKAGTGIEAGKLEAALAYDEYLQVKDINGVPMDPDVARGAALIVGTANGSLEVLALGKLVKMLPGAEKLMAGISRQNMRQMMRIPTVQQALAKFGKNLGTVTMTEAGVEALQELFQILGQEAAQAYTGGEYEDADLQGSLDQIAHAARRGGQAAFGMGLPTGGITASMDVIEARQAEKRRQFFDSLGKEAAQIKLRERMPSKFREWLDTIVGEDGSVDSVYLEPEVAERFFQETDLTDEQIAEMMPETWDALQESRQTGADVQIPLAEFVEHVAPSSILNSMVDDLKFAPNEMSVNQARVNREDQDRQYQEFQDRIEEAQPVEGEQVYTDFYRMLTKDTGYAPAQAAAQAQLMQQAFAAFGEGLPMSADQFAEMVKVSVASEDLSLMGDKPAIMPTYMDSLLNTLRGGQLPGQRDMYGKSFIDRIMEKGGIQDEGGELGARDLDQSLEDYGRRKLSREEGMTFEEAYELGFQEGFLPEGEVGFNAVLQAIDDELAGEPVFSSEGQVSSQIELRSQLDQLEEYLREQGLDVQDLTNEEIKAAMEEETFYQFAGEQSQTADMLSLVEAIEQIEQGVDPEQVRRDTGWHQGDEDKWRYEISDVDANLLPPDKIAELEDVNQGIVYLGEVLEHEKLYAAYPNLKQTRVKFIKGRSASYNSISGQIDLGRDLSPGEMQSTLLHEVQHAIQNVEGFARGGTIKEFTDQVKEDRKFQLQAKAEIEKISRDVFDGQSLSEIEDDLAAQEENNEITFNQYREQYLEAYGKLGEAVRKTPGGEAVWEKATAKVFTERQRYQLLAGEVEARATESRRMMDDEMRRLSPPEQSVEAWINPEDIIIVFNGEDVQNAPIPENVFKQEVDLGPQKGKQAKGYIEMDELRSYFRITITGKADLSTFLHESGHFFLEAMHKAAEIEGADPRFANDIKTIREWMGLKEGEPILREQHEQFARGFEAYLMEGESPSNVLHDIFQTFKSWLLRIYRQVKSLNVELTPEVRGVMDRLLASDEQIREKADTYIPIFESADAAGMTEAEYQRYQDNHQKAMQQAKLQVDRELVKEVTREKEAQYKFRKKQIQEEVETEINREPVYAVQRLIRSRTTPAEFEVPEFMEGKRLSREYILDLFPDPQILGDLTGLYSKEGGLHPDGFAGVFGFETGYKMIQQIIVNPPRAQAIEQRVDQRMREEFGDIIRDGKLEAKVEKAMHLDSVTRHLKAESMALGKKVGRESSESTDAMARRAAMERIRSLPLHKLQPQKYLQAEKKFAKLAFSAAASKDFKAADQYKLQELLNRYMYIEVAIVREDFEKTRTHLRIFNNPTIRKKIGKAGATKQMGETSDYMGAIDTILDQLDLRKTPFLHTDRRINLRAFLDQQEEQGIHMEIDPVVMDVIELKSYQELSLADFFEIRDAVDHIYHQAIFRHQLMVNKEKWELQATVDDMVSLMELNAPGAYKDITFKREMGFKGSEHLEDVKSALTKTEFITKWMDGKLTGRAWETIFKPFVTAQNEKMDKLEVMGKELESHFDDMNRADRRRLNQTVTFMGIPIRRRNIYAVALNMGNEGNLNKLLQGYDWDYANVLSELQEQLTEKDFIAIQKIWDTVGSLWPDIETLYKRNVGIVPPKIEATKLYLPKYNMVLEGGYYPVVYDKDLDMKQAVRGAVGDALFENNLLGKGVSKGFTEARTKYVGQIQLSLDVIPSHLNEVVHYLTHYEAVTNTDKLINHPEFMEQFVKSFGKAHYMRLKPWIQEIAKGGTTPTELQWFDNYSSKARIGMSVASMGLNLGTGTSQLLGLVTTADEIGVADTLRGIGKAITGGPAAWKFVNDNYAELRHIRQQSDREIAHAINSNTGLFQGPAAKNWNHFKNTSFVFVIAFQSVVNMATWTGSYNKAQRDGKSHDQASDYAASVVRMTQSGAGAKDLAAIQRGGELTKLATAFYTYFSVLYNRQRDMAREVSGLAKSASYAEMIQVIAVRSMLLIFLPVVMDAMMRGKGPDEDEDEGYLAWMAKESVGYGSLGIPGFRDLMGGLTSDFDANPVPALQIIDKGVKMFELGGDLVSGERDFDEIKAYEYKRMAELASWVTQAPIKGLAKWGEAGMGVYEGDIEDPEAVVRAFLYGVPYKK